jgi:ribonucleotide monophosphatase NagD (HAD superfamily)
MFFLLFSKNSATLVKLFEKQGIIIRNKHDDVPFSVRISMPTIAILEEILDICEDINKEYLEKKFNLKNILPQIKNIIFDLDGTLRDGSHWSGQNSDTLNTLTLLKNKGYNIYIATNNTSHSVKEIEIHTGINECNIISPITRLHNFIDITKEIYVIGNDDTYQYLDNNGYNINNENKEYEYILFANSYFLTGEQWKIIANNKKATYLICDNSDYVSVKHCSDVIYNLTEENLIIPDIGTYINIIKKLHGDIQVINIGKPNKQLLDSIPDINNSIFVGDSIKNDIGLAHEICCYPILINTTDEIGYNLYYDCFILNHVNQLNSYL